MLSRGLELHSRLPQQLLQIIRLQLLARGDASVRLQFLVTHIVIKTQCFFGETQKKRKRNCLAKDVVPQKQRQEGLHCLGPGMFLVDEAPTRGEPHQAAAPAGSCTVPHAEKQ